MKFPEKIKIVEVGPRDGLQNEIKVIPIEEKLHFIQGLLEAGLKYIEITSFVNPKKITQFTDAKELTARIMPIISSTSIVISALVPNEKGLEDALACKINEVAVFTSSSDEFNLHNINTDIEGSFTRIEPVAKKAILNKVKVRGYLSTVIECPYFGKINPKKVAELVKRLLDLGCYEVSLGETLGVAVPLETSVLFEEVLKIARPDQVAFHCHDTYGTALSNVFAAMEYGIATFDTSSGGLGGCPYAPGASGNLATEDLVYFCARQGIETGISLEKIVTASSQIFKYLNKTSPSKVNQAFLLKSYSAT